MADAKPALDEKLTTATAQPAPTQKAETRAANHVT